MALEDIQKKIISDAEQRKSELLEKAEQQAAEIIGAAKKEAQEYGEDQSKLALSSAENLERGLVIDARRKLANEILARKRDRIEQTFAKAKADFMASGDYPEIMKKLVLKSVSSKKEEIQVGKDDSVLNQAWLDSVNAAGGAQLTLSADKGGFEGGVIVQEGDVFINITLDTLFSLLREDTEKPVADILFGS